MLYVAILINVHVCITFNWPRLSRLQCDIKKMGLSPLLMLLDCGFLCEGLGSDFP